MNSPYLFGFSGRDATIPDMTDKVERPLTPHDVSLLFGVDPKTIARWAKDGRLPFFMTPGGHRRYPATEINAMLNGTFTPITPKGEAVAVPELAVGDAA